MEKRQDDDYIAMKTLQLQYIKPTFGLEKVKGTAKLMGYLLIQPFDTTQISRISQVKGHFKRVNI